MSQSSWHRDMLDPTALARLSSVPLLPRRAMQGTVSGRHPSPHRGSSVEFAEYRRYVPGDDLRRVDWRALGRTDRYYVKEFEADTNLRCCIVLDVSGSMGFGSEGISKLDYGRNLSGALSHLAIRQGDAVGLACAAAGLLHDIPPRRSPVHLKVILEHLESLEPAGETQLIDVLHQMAEEVSQRALIVIISDLFLPPEELKGCFEHLRFRKHDVAVFQLLDKQELAFDFHRPMRFVDMEGNASIFTDPTEIAERYHRVLQQHLQAIKDLLMESGVDYHRIRLDQPYEAVLMEFLGSRHTLRGGR